MGVEARRRESIHHACLCCAGMCERKKLQDDRLRNVSERLCVQQRQRTVGFIEGGNRKARGLKQANCEGEESRGSESL